MSFESFTLHTTLVLWYSDQVSKQRTTGIAPASVRVNITLGLTHLKHLRITWTTKVYEMLTTKMTTKSMTSGHMEYYMS